MAARPEPINATFHHSKAKVTLYFSDPLFIAGDNVSGKMELECRADKGLGLADIKVELFAIQELTSRDHSATSTFLHLTREFQGPGLPPSNAVYPHPPPGSDPLPVDYSHARKGTTTFFFHFPLPLSSPASIEFGKGLAKIKYEVRASIGLSWRNDRQRLLDRKEVRVVEAMGVPCNELGNERIVVGENGKVWMQGRMLNPYVVSGQSTCVELYVKNHTSKKSSSLSLTLSRHLHLPTSVQSKRALQISDTLYGTSYKGEEYTVQHGTEGVANLVFTVPKNAEGVRSGPFETGEDDPRERESLFSVRCLIEIRLSLGIGSKDVVLEMPVTIVHPAAMRSYPSPEPPVVSSETYISSISPPMPSIPISPAAYVSPMSPPPMMYPNLPAQQHENDVFSLGRVGSPSYNLFPGYMSSPPPIPQAIYDQHYYYPPPPLVPYQYYMRPSSADPFIAHQLPILPTNSANASPARLAEERHHTEDALQQSPSAAEGELGKGERASRIAAHLRLSSRTRSVSPTSHRFPQNLPMMLETNEQSVSPQRLQPDSHAPTDVMLNISPRSEGAKTNDNVAVLSPRPVLRHQNSFTVDHGTVKSERVVDLERMAAVGLQPSVQAPGRLPEDEVNNSIQSPQPAEADINDPLVPPPEPILTPIFIPRKREFKLEDGGLDALERRLLEQVGTRKPDLERRPDVREILSQPISIPHTHPQDPANDSAISSLTLNAEELLSSPARNGQGKQLPATPSESSQAGHEKADKAVETGSSSGKSKRSEVHELRKVATSRVAAWLGGLDDAVAPPATDTPSTDSPKTPAEEIMPVDDLDPHPLLRSPPLLASLPQDGPIDQAIPTRSSGFILHSARDPTETFGPDGPGNADTELIRSKTPTQADISANVLLTSPPKMPAMKPVLQRFLGAYAQPTGAAAKYDIRSARGGKGGRVTSAAALWSSITSQENPIPNGTSKPTQAKPRTPPATNGHAGPSIPPPHRKNKEVLTNLNVADLTQRRVRMVKGASVPAVLSSSLATPVLSSTASLARPIRSEYPRQTYPLINENTAAVLSSQSSSDIRQQAAKPAAAGAMAFGQTRLKDLIKKYQQGFGP